jgi:hypothetical protein
MRMITLPARALLAQSCNRIAQPVIALLVESSAMSIDGRWTITAVVQSATDAVEVPMELTTR